jgi:hypothetical protein
MPHGYCYRWQPGLVWLHVLPNSLVARAHFSVPITLMYLIRKTKTCYSIGCSSASAFLSPLTARRTR